MTATNDEQRAVVAAQLHQQAAGLTEQSRQSRVARDAIIRALRASDPKTWTMGNLAAAVGCSKELVAHILRQGVPGEDDSAAGAALRVRPVQGQPGDLERHVPGEVP